MAISIIHQPTNTRPAFHPIAWLVSSTNSSDANYRYTFEIRQGATVIRRFKVRPRPGDAYGYFDLSPHLSRLIDQLDFEIKSGSNLQGAAAYEYDLYIEGGGETVSDAPLVFMSNTAFNTVFTRDEYVGLDVNDWLLTSATACPLWNIEDRTEVLKDDLFWLHFIDDAGRVDILRITQYDKSGNPVFSPAIDIPFGTLVLANMVKMDLSSMTFTATTAQIGVQFFESGNAASKEIRLLLVDPCSSYTRHKFVYIDSKGSYNSLNFDLRSTESFGNDVKTYRKRIDPLTEQDTSRGLQRYFVDVNETFSVNSDILDDKHNRMYKDLLNSTQVFLDVRNDAAWPNHEYVPVEILTNSQTMKKGENIEIIQYPLQFRFTNETVAR